LRRKGLVIVRTDPDDRRARNVGLTEAGTALVAELPLGGRRGWRTIEGEAQRLDRLAASLADAVPLFGLEAWEPGRKKGPPAA